MKHAVMGALCALIMAFLLVASAQAQSIKVDLDKIPPDLAAKVLEAQKKQPSIPVPTTAEQAKEWADIGKHVGEAVAATAKALNTEVNDFVKMPVGTAAFYLVVWKIVGAKLWSIVGGSIIWLVLGPLIYRSFRLLHPPAVSGSGKGQGRQGCGQVAGL